MGPLSVETKQGEGEQDQKTIRAAQKEDSSPWGQQAGLFPVAHTPFVSSVWPQSCTKRNMSKHTCDFSHDANKSNQFKCSSTVTGGHTHTHTCCV